MTELQYSRNTVGCNIGGEIFIHPELYKNPELYNAIVEHEKKHSDGINLYDISQDVFNDELEYLKKDFYLFILKHPRTLMGALPITKIGKYWAFDFQITVVWAFIIGAIYFVGRSF